MMKKHMLFVCSLLLFVGCVSVDYSPPTQNNKPDNYTKIVKQSYDQVWKTLIQYTAGTFFAIEDFEKDSGLMILSFGASNPEKYITGGRWKAKNLSQEFNGDYVEYISIYGGGTLKGKMNIVVTEIDPGTTKITVNARYIFSANHGNIWSFDSGSCGTIAVKGKAAGTSSTRTICPTYKAEKAILSIF